MSSTALYWTECACGMYPDAYVGRYVNIVKCELIYEEGWYWAKAFPCVYEDGKYSGAVECEAVKRPLLKCENPNRRDEHYALSAMYFCDKGMMNYICSYYGLYLIPNGAWTAERSSQQ